VRVFADVEQRVGVRSVPGRVQSFDVQSHGAGAARVGVQAARLAVSTQGHRLTSIVIRLNDDHVGLADRLWTTRVAPARAATLKLFWNCCTTRVPVDGGPEIEPTPLLKLIYVGCVAQW